MKSVWRRISQQLHKLLSAEAGTPDENTQSAAVEFLVVRYDNLSVGIVSAENDVAARLAFEVESCLFQRFDTLPARDSR